MPHLAIHAIENNACPAVLSAQAAAARKVMPLAPVCARMSAAQRDMIDLVRRGRRAALPTIYGELVARRSDEKSIDWTGALPLAGSVGTIELVDGERLIRGLTGIDLPDLSERGGEHLRWMQAAVSGRLAGTPFDGWNCLGEDVPPLGEGAMALKLSLASGQYRIETWARADVMVWRAFFAHAAWEYENVISPAWPDLTIRANVTVAKHTLPASMLAQLAQGDLILPDTVRFGTDGEGRITIGCRELIVQYRHPSILDVIAVGGQVSEEQVEQNADYDGASGEGAQEYVEGQEAEGAEEYDEGQEAEGAEEYAEGQEAEGAEEYAGEQEAEGAEEYAGEQEAEGASAEGYVAQAEMEGGDPQQGGYTSPDGAGDGGPSLQTAMDRLPVTLHFQLGKVSVPLSTLRTLDAGAVIMLEGGSPGAIAIVADGKTFGRGELVDVEGTLGIRITDWIA
jgi:type III secretion protein Q